MGTTLKPLPAPFAPWAEIVPGYGPVTVDILLTLADDGYVYEVVEGVLVRMAGSGFNATTIGGNLYFALRSFAQPRRLGVATPTDGVYKFPGAETGLLPDVGFVQAARVAHIPDRRKPVPFAPDLAIEVASPDQKPEAMAAKARTYLDGGTRLVWVVRPDQRQIDVWRAGRSVGPVAVLGVDYTLDGEDVVPGFTYPVAAIFADPLD
jgi:Uma2 family endonuclease